MISFFFVWVLLLLLTYFLLRISVLLIGSRLPREHLTQVMRDVPLALDDVFNVMRDLQTWQIWSFYCQDRIGLYHSEFTGPQSGLGQVWRWRGNDLSGHMEIRQEWHCMRLLLCVVWDAIPESKWDRIEFVQNGGLCRIIWQTYGDRSEDPWIRFLQYLFGPRKLNRAKHQSLDQLEEYVRSRQSGFKSNTQLDLQS